MKTLKIVRSLLVLIPFLFLVACGGGGSDAPAAAGGGTTSVTSSGVMTKGSVILNGVAFAVSVSTAISVDDDPSALEDNLKNGMVVRLRGQRNDDGVNGTADAVETENEVQGKVESVTPGVPNSFVVLGQTIFVDENTVYEAPLTNFSSIAANNIVEVHGLRDDQGNLRATRIEDKIALGPDEAELKGIILTANFVANTSFEIGTVGGTTQEVNYDGTTIIEPAGATINIGDLVEVKGNLVGGILEAAVIQREDLEDDEFEPAEGEEIEVEGLMAGFTNHPGAFTVNNRDIETTPATIFRNGSEEDLINGAKVEAEGHLSGGILLARKITFKNKRIDIQAEATATPPNAVTVLGLNVAIAPFTDNAGITIGQNYRIRGFDDGGTIIAERIRNAGGGDDWFKAMVTAKDEGGQTLEFLEGTISVNMSSPPVFNNAADEIITEGEFYAGVTAGATIVKVKFNSGAFPTVKEASLED